MDVIRPNENSLDWVCSVAAGWDPESNRQPNYSFGNLTFDPFDFKHQLEHFISSAKEEIPSLLNPISEIIEPEEFPEISNPIEEKMAVIDPVRSTETGLIPIAALWQSGWENSFPYIFVRESVYQKLLDAVLTLRKLNPEISLVISDGWRSTEIQKQLYDSFYPNGHIDGEPLYVSPPDVNGRYSAPHTCGGAVDVLLGINKKPIRLGSDLDEMDEQSHTCHFENKDSLEPNEILIRDLRRILLNALYEQDFVSIDSEWWHVEYGTRRWAGSKNCEPIYDKVEVDIDDFRHIQKVEPVSGSKRKTMKES